MEEEWRDIKLLERKIELNKQMYLEFGRLLSLDEETVNAIENLINKNKELEKEVRLISENEHYEDLIYALKTYYGITEEDLEKCMKNDR